MSGVGGAAIGKESCIFAIWIAVLRSDIRDTGIDLVRDIISRWDGHGEIQRCLDCRTCRRGFVPEGIQAHVFSHSSNGLQAKGSAIRQQRLMMAVLGAHDHCREIVASVMIRSRTDCLKWLNIRVDQFENHRSYDGILTCLFPVCADLVQVLLAEVGRCRVFGLRGIPDQNLESS